MGFSKVATTHKDMKKIILLTLLSFCSLIYAQNVSDSLNARKVIYKSFVVGMTKSEATKEFDRDKPAYKNINLENGCSYRVLPAMFSYNLNKKLFGVGLISNTVPALRKAAIIEYFDKSKEFFENHGYKFYFQPNTSHMLHIYMINDEKDTILEMFTMNSGAGFWYVNWVFIYDRSEFLKTDYYIKMSKTANFDKNKRNDTLNDSGF